MTLLVTRSGWHEGGGGRLHGEYSAIPPGTRQLAICACLLPSCHRAPTQVPPDAYIGEPDPGPDPRLYLNLFCPNKYTSNKMNRCNYHNADGRNQLNSDSLSITQRGKLSHRAHVPLIPINYLIEIVLSTSRFCLRTYCRISLNTNRNELHIN